MRDSREQGTKKSSVPAMACILPLQGRRTNLPCYHLALRLPRGRTPQRVGCYPSSSITAGLCRRSLAYYYKVSSVRSSKTMFGSALRVPLSPPELALTYFTAYSSLHSFLQMCSGKQRFPVYSVILLYWRRFVKSVCGAVCPALPAE